MPPVYEPVQDWDELISGIPPHELHHVFDFPPPYDVAVRSSYAPSLYTIEEESLSNHNQNSAAIPSLSPNTARMLQEFPEAHPPNHPVYKCAEEARMVRRYPTPDLTIYSYHVTSQQAPDSVDPGLLQPHPVTTFIPDSSDLDDISNAIAAALSSEEEMLRVIDDSSEEEEELTTDMIVGHIWSGLDIKYT
jgi:hypothetical protein